MHLPRLRMRASLSLGLGLLFVLAAVSSGAPPWAQLIPFRKAPPPVKTAAATVDYSLTEQQGPWMIMCTSFVGEAGEAQANELARELRSRYRLQAYIFRQHFDYNQQEVGLGLNKFGGAKKMKPMRPKEFDEVAVMIGNFESVNDPALEATLKTIKALKPASMVPASPSQGKQATKPTQPLATRFGDLYRSILPQNDQRRARGPLARAFVTRNPMLPEEYFVAKGLDPFVVQLNKDLPHSLLRNPKKYTVKVATFRGVDTMKPQEFDRLVSEGMNRPKIDIAAEKARDLCVALRKKGVEAYEFHDVSESIVTIGSFDSVGEERADGKTEINPAVHRVMLEYQATQQPIPGHTNLGIVPKKLAGINFDAQPMPVEVPRQSLAANYNSTNSALR